MMYKFLTLVDGTEIVHSDMLDDGRVKVYVEKPDANDCFHHMTCYLPSYEVTEKYGLSEEEMSGAMEVIRSTANLILEFAKGKGFENAAGF
ncbi:MAG: hypothetical protein KBS81_06645 [Spirochaetales bacterium]|nr:hypothetical protein [Candidatus Physcosoma equi]